MENRSGEERERTNQKFSLGHIEFKRCYVEIPKSILRFNDFPEGFMDLRKTSALMVVIYYYKRMQIKNQPRKKVQRTESRRDQV